jgi:hypothetical protein
LQAQTKEYLAKIDALVQKHRQPLPSSLASSSSSSSSSSSLSAEASSTSDLKQESKEESESKEETTLLSQPSNLTGGTLKDYQLTGEVEHRWPKPALGREQTGWPWYPSI